MPDQELLEDISKKLSILICLELQRDGTGRVQDHVSQLSRFGLSAGEMAEILGTTPGTVMVAKARIKKKGK